MELNCSSLNYIDCIAALMWPLLGGLAVQGLRHSSLSDFLGVY